LFNVSAIQSKTSLHKLLLSKDRSVWFTIYLQSMMRVSNALAAAAASLLVGRVVANVDPIVIKGSKFFYSTNGTQL
jgi:hypothetical protein